MVTVPQQYQKDVQQAAAATGLPYSVVATQISVESGYNPKAVSPAGAEGIAQFMPGTWAGLHIGGSPFDPNAAFRGYSKYMKQLLRDEHGSVRNALAAYNAGEGNLSAGYGYADEILSGAKQKVTLTSSGGSGNIIGDIGSLFDGSAAKKFFDTLSNLFNPLTWLTDLFGGGVKSAEHTALDWIQRGALILLGAIVLLIGVIVLVRPSNIEAAATGGASKAFGEQRNARKQQAQAAESAADGS